MSFVHGVKSSTSSRKKRWPKVLLTIFLLLILAAGGGFLQLRSWYSAQLQAVNADGREVTFVVLAGESIDTIGKHLEQANLIRNARAFSWYGRLNNAHDSLQAGTYSLSPSMSVQTIVSKLTGGKIASTLFTILPAQRLDQIHKALQDAGYETSEIDKALDSSTYANHPLFSGKKIPKSLEGYLYPDSFQKTGTTRAADLIKLSLDEMYKKLDTDTLAGFKQQNITVEQGIILASIVEKEVSNKDDRPKVAQVFLKRYRDGIKLGSDVTAFYGSIIAGVDPSVFYDTPYNTRLHEGLPPGPINNVSDSSLHAVAHPATTDYLFFVSGDGADEGKTFFARTLEEHEANVAAHCRQLCGQ